MKLSKYAQLFPAGTSDRPTIDDTTIEKLAKLCGAVDDTESRIPAGYTYFGQFVDHDLSFMEQTDKEPGKHPVPLSYLRNRRGPSLDLDSIYGAGLYDSAVPFNHTTGAFEMGRISTGEPRDLPRGKNFRALIADSRNDENLLVAQMQVLFMNLHNKIVSHIRRDNPKIDAFTALDRARREVVQLYRHVVLHDFAARLLNNTVYKAIICNGEGRLSRLGLHTHEISIEFAVAAFRLHAMVRRTYVLQSRARSVALPQLFTYQLDPIHQRTNILRKSLAVDWRLFFGEEAQRAHSISPHISFDVPGVIARVFSTAKTQYMTSNIAPSSAPAIAAAVIHQLKNNQHQVLEENQQSSGGAFNLLKRTLLRGKELQLASANYIIFNIRTQHPKLANALRLGEFSSDFLVQHYPTEDWTKKLPLWLYCMLEGKERCNGSRLGILGGWIVADTLVNATQTSHIQLDPKWTVTASPVYQALGTHAPGKRTRGRLTLMNLIEYTYHTPAENI